MVVQRRSDSETSIGQTQVPSFEMAGYNIDGSKARKRMFSDAMPDTIPEQDQNGTVVITKIPNKGVIVLDDGTGPYDMARH